MSQVFPKSTEYGAKLAVLAFALTLVALVAWGVANSREYQGIGEPIHQPIPFSHKHHVGDDGIDCRYCHVTVETQAFAGMPSTDTCLTCHSQLYAGAPMLSALRESAASGQPIAWRRVHTLPDFVYFNHSVHLAKGVACIECHGRIDQMPITWRAKPLEMQWCLGCHRNASMHLRPVALVFEMRANPLSSAQRLALARSLHLPSVRRLTDCSTCHR